MSVETLTTSEAVINWSLKIIFIENSFIICLFLFVFVIPIYICIYDRIGQPLHFVCNFNSSNCQDKIILLSFIFLIIYKIFST